jgi:dolichol-phosphate mannosyltransferase
MYLLSVVIPARNERDNILTLLDAIDIALHPVGPYEVIVVDDGSADATADALRDRAASHPHLRVFRNAVSAGQSAAIHSGVTEASAEIVCTLDGDGQNPPEELPRLFDALTGAPPGVALIAGQRTKRNDTLSKRLASRWANAIRSALLNDGTRDSGCGLKAFRRSAFLALPYFDHMHRYLPALFIRDGWTVVHLDVGHRQRGAGSSNYGNFQRGLVGIVDLLGVIWLIRRRKKTQPEPLASVQSQSGDI